MALTAQGHIVKKRNNLLSVVDPDDKVAEDVHVIDEGLIGGVIRTETLVDFAIGEELGAHIVQVVAFLEVAEVRPKFRIAYKSQLLREAV